MEIDFNGRYGEQTKGGYIHYKFMNPDSTKLHELICESSPIGHPWGEATLTRRDSTGVKSLLLLSSEQGYFFQSNDNRLISCWDARRLREIIRPDDFEVPLGCFVPVKEAWDVVNTFIESGELSDCIKWILWNDIPEDAAWRFDK